MAETLTPSRLRQLAEVQPEQGRVLSVYMDLDPSEFGTPPARASADHLAASPTPATGSTSSTTLSHDERKALRADVETVRDVLSQPGIADGGRARRRRLRVQPRRPAGDDARPAPAGARRW